MGATKTLLTFEEFEQLPDQPVKRELLKGELIELPPPDLRHNRISYRAAKRLDAALEAARARGEASELGEVCHEVGFKLASDILLIPDVGITHAAQPEGKYFEGSPAIAIEVISPSNTVKEMKRKTELYFEFGAKEVWRLDPARRGIRVHLRDSSYDLAEDEILTTPLLPGLALPVREILGE